MESLAIKLQPLRLRLDLTLEVRSRTMGIPPVSSVDTPTILGPGVVFAHLFGRGQPEPQVQDCEISTSPEGRMVFPSNVNVISTRKMGTSRHINKCRRDQHAKTFLILVDQKLR